jgi:hypothetical protein
LCGETAVAGFELEDEIAATDRYGIKADVGLAVEVLMLAFVASRELHKRG